MQENKLISTIETLNSFGQTESIKVLAKELKEAYDFAMSIIAHRDLKTDNVKIIPSEPVKSDVVKNSSYHDYNPKWNLKNKFLYILKKEDRFLHFREVAKIILSLEGKETSYENQRDLARLLTNNTALRNFRKTGTIINIKHNDSPKKSFWGSKKWLNEKGEIKPEHSYSLKIMNEKNKDAKPTKKEERDLFDI